MMVFPPAPNNFNVNLPPVAVIPGNLLITNITNSYPMVATIVDSDVNSYIPGQSVILTVPSPYGMNQADGKVGKILDIDDLDFYLDIDSRAFDVFVTPGDGFWIQRPASLSCYGSTNLQFDNTTAKVPYQNLNDRGN
jgi:hypothetical protein